MTNSAVLLEIKEDSSEQPQLSRAATPAVAAVLGPTEAYHRALRDLIRRVDASLEPLRADLAHWRMAAATLYWRIEDDLPDNP